MMTDDPPTVTKHQSKTPKPSSEASSDDVLPSVSIPTNFSMSVLAKLQKRSNKLTDWAMECTEHLHQQPPAASERQDHEDWLQCSNHLEIEPSADFAHYFMPESEDRDGWMREMIADVKKKLAVHKAAKSEHDKADDRAKIVDEDEEDEEEWLLVCPVEESVDTDGDAQGE